MDQVPHNLSGFAGTHLDGIAIHSDGWEHHLEHLHVVVIPQVSTRVVLLTDLIGSQSLNQVQGKEEAIVAFNDIQQSLSKQSGLYSPDFDEAFIVQTHALDGGLGAVLRFVIQ